MLFLRRRDSHFAQIGQKLPISLKANGCSCKYLEWLSSWFLHPTKIQIAFEWVLGHLWHFRLLFWKGHFWHFRLLLFLERSSCAGASTPVRGERSRVCSATEAAKAAYLFCVYFVPKNKLECITAPLWLLGHFPCRTVFTFGSGFFC